MLRHPQLRAAYRCLHVFLPHSSDVITVHVSLGPATPIPTTHTRTHTHLSCDTAALDVVNPIAVGSPLPDVQVYDENLALVNIRDIFADKKGILFGVPGAFTPTCSKTHVPGYVKDRQALQDKGIGVIACVSVNDRYVMAAWGEDQKAAGAVRMLADESCALSRALGVSDASYIEKLGSVRCRRFAMIVENNVVTKVNVEQPSSAGAPTCSFAPDILSQL